MVKPSPALCGRIRFTTKQVARGFYRGNRTGSMGAHTEYGKYMIDWRKTTHFVVPDTTDFALSPFITQAMEPTLRSVEGSNGELYTPERVDGLEFLRSWKKLNPYEYDSVVAEQRKLIVNAANGAQSEDEIPEQIQEPVQEEIYAKSVQSGRNPFQQQTRQMHTSSRRLISAQEPTPSDLELNSPNTKEWLSMSREERKTLINTATTAKLRAIKKERGGEKIHSEEKRKVKTGIKSLLRQELIGTGIFENKKEYDKMMAMEGRNRTREGLPRRTPDEKREFLIGLLEKTGDAEAVLQRISEAPAAELMKNPLEKMTKTG